MYSSDSDIYPEDISDIMYFPLTYFTYYDNI